MNRRFLVVQTTLLSICLSHSAWCAENISYAKVRCSGASAHVVSINLNSPDLKVSVSLAKNGRGSSESFGSMVHRAKPAAAITGTFFCTRSLLPTGDIVIEGKRIHTGCIGTGICVTPGNTVEFVPYNTGHKNRWQGYETVLCAGPTLVRKGSMFLSPRDQGFHDPALFGAKRRTAVGVTAGNKLLMVTVDKPVQLRTLAKIMMQLGAVDAAALDGGSSTALHYKGRTISSPGRSLTNLLVVYNTQTDYVQHREALAPALRHTQVASMAIKTTPVKSIMTSMALPNAFPRTAMDMIFRPTYGIEQYGEDHPMGIRDDGTPLTGSERREPLLPSTDTALTAGNKETSLAVLTMRPARRTQREQSELVSSRLLMH